MKNRTEQNRTHNCLVVGKCRIAILFIRHIIYRILVRTRMPNQIGPSGRQNAEKFHLPFVPGMLFTRN